MEDNNTQVAVIGAGPGGYAAAFLAADMGMAVTLIDPAENPGGVCLYRGCIPSKALLHVSRLIDEASHAADWGVSFGKPKIDIQRMRAWKSEIIDGLTGGLGRLVAQRKINHVRATARFMDDHTLSLADMEGKTSTLGFAHAVLATGSAAVDIPLFPADSDRIWNSKKALDLETVPTTLLVVGGGYIGLELGSVYAALGSDVTVVEMLPHLLAGADRDLVRFLARRLTDRFKAILLGTTVAAAKVQKNGVKVTFGGQDDKPLTRLFQRVLVAVGRRPRSAGLGLETAGVTLDEGGFVKIDAHCRTAAQHIFAIGDVAGQPMLAHKAAYEARIAVETIAGKNVIADPAAIPAVVFTDPEVAWTGLTESAAKTGGTAVEVTRFPWAASGRAVSLGRSDGLTKLVIDPASERLLGAGIVGPGAGELIAEATLAIEMGANATDLGLTIHPHPTLAETLKEAADIFHGTATHYYRPKRKKKNE
ncbi:dihydrolipoyl dehydrogenase [Desulfosarcina alkanivorans]|uniref:Dihydrolipoyl dehydrogenase n=1 Tax=Desulfosarcina alkanivorans TaxID=571177 RepID=A0A5K7YR19_9BACT|nr:dihydrolipoyl dehydrogenase [Desulfosarcina alkanivorans]BBO70349.1 dihydrolipoyl dehydrogenase [Desulfosarcina alkanivorans]